jgi:molybdenum cofactor cytidylyltransferase
MKAQAVGVKESRGRILYFTIFRPGGRKLLAKGHVLSEEDVHRLEREGLGQVWVTDFEEGEAVEGRGGSEPPLAANGGAGFFAREDDYVSDDDPLLKQVNHAASIRIRGGSGG